MINYDKNRLKMKNGSIELGQDMNRNILIQNVPQYDDDYVQ